MKEISAISQVEGIKNYKNSIVIIQNDSFSVSEVKYSKKSIDSIDVENDYIIKTNNKEKSVFVLTENEFKSLNNGYVYADILDINNYILVNFDYNKSKTLYLVIREFNSYEIEKEGFYNIVSQSDNSFILKEMFDKNFIEKNSLNNSPLWTYTCPEGQKIEGNMYEYGGVLAFIEEDEEVNTTLVGLDMKTGKILYKKEVNLIYYKQQENMLYGFAANSFGDNFYIEINIETGDVTEKSFKNYKNDINSHLAMIKEHFLYYSIYKKGGIGIIDLKKREIIQEYPLNLPEGVEIDAPVVTDDKIYVLDSEQVLHIYERPNL